MNIEILSDHDLRKNLISNIDQSINEYLESEQIKYLTNKDIYRLKSDLIKYLNDPYEYVFLIKDIYFTTLEIYFLNKLNINDPDHMDSFNEIFSEFNLIVSIDKDYEISDKDPIRDNLYIEIMGLCHNEDAASVHNIRIPFLNPVEIIE